LDGLNNYDELKYGTSPIAGDTDHGGENDISEVYNNRDPYSDADDDLVPPHFIVIPGNENVTLFFQPRPGVVNFKLYRASNSNKSFVLINDSIDAAIHEITDLDLTNGEVYYYRMIAVNNKTAESGFSPIVRACPNTHTKTPTGFVFINKGDQYTNNPTVTLTLIIDDSNIHFMRVSQSTSFASVPWIPFQEQLTFTLIGTGPQFVYVEFKDSFNNIGGDDQGLYAFDGIIVDPNYSSIETSSTSSSSATTYGPFEFFSLILVSLLIVSIKKKWNF
jgi:hypothetical protein